MELNIKISKNDKNILKKFFIKNPEMIGEFNTENKFKTCIPENYVWINKQHIKMDIDNEKFVPQKHCWSVEPHVDDCLYDFCLIVIKTELSREAKHITRNQFIRRAKFNYTSINGVQMLRFLQEGDVIFFNPRKEHSLIFYGEYVTLLLTSIGKICL